MRRGNRSTQRAFVRNFVAGMRGRRRAAFLLGIRKQGLLRGMYRRLLFELRSPLLSQLLPVVIANNPRHISSRFIIRRHSAILLHTQWASIVGREGLGQIEVVLLQ